MKSIHCSRRLSLIFGLILLLGPLALWSDAARPLKIFVSVEPLKYLAEQVGGKDVDVHVMIAPGQSPATFEPTPREMTGLRGAKLFVRIGVPSEKAWLPRVIRNNPELMMIDGRDGIAPQVEAEGAGHHQHGHDHGGLDPHVWNSPETSLQIAATIEKALIQLDPAHRQEYERNYRDLEQRFNKLDVEIAAQMESVSPRRFMVFHPAWAYFAKHYGLEQMAIEREGKSPGIRSLGKLVDQARKAGIRTIIVQPQFPIRDARVIAREIGGKVVAVDPLGYDIPTNLRQMAAAIAGTPAQP